MKKSIWLKVQLHMILFLLACILTAFPVKAALKTETLRSADAFGDALLELTEAYACDSGQELTLNLTSDQVRDENGALTGTYDSEVKEALDCKTTAKAQAYLEEQGYTVTEVSGSSVTVADPYQSLRVLTYGESLPDTDGAVKVIHYKHNHILQYDSKEAAIAAYESLSASYAGEVYRDGFFYAGSEETLDTDEEQELSAQALTENGESTHLSWGVKSMGLDTLQTLYQDVKLPEVLVAVVDGGVDAGSSYYKGRVINGYDFADNDTDPSPVEGSSDLWFHGSHVAGIICDGTTDNVKILNVRALNSSGGGSYLAVTAAIYYSLQKGADVINLSLSSQSEPVALVETALSDAANQDVILCAAAGNQALDVSNFYPANSSYTWAVNGIDSSESYYYKYAYGEGIDFCAPGVDIVSVGGNTTESNATATKSGTSMASPHIAAAAAMVLSIYPGSSRDEVKDILIDNCRDLGAEGKDDYYGYGLVDFSGWAEEKGACIHDFEAGVPVTEGCRETTTYTCSLCQVSYTETVEDHSPGDTLYSDGSCHYKLCSLCGEAVEKEGCSPKSSYFVSDEAHYRCCVTCGEIISWTVEEHDLEDSYSSDSDNHWYHCEICTGKVYKEAHSFEIQEETPASCTEDGEKVYACTVCGYSYTEVLPATGHSCESWESDGEYHWGFCETCQADTGKLPCEIQTGVYLNDPAKGHYRKCKVCGKVMTSTFEEHTTDGTYQSDEIEHWQKCTKHSGKVYTEAHTEGHYDTDEEGHLKTCEVCGYELGEKEAHSFEIQEETPASCTKDGEKVYACTICGYSYREVLPATGHSYELTFKTASTETEQGEETYTCSACQDSYEEALPLAAHVHKLTKKVLSKPTYIKNGSVSLSCTGCNYSYTESTDKLACPKVGSLLYIGRCTYKVTGYTDSYGLVSLVAYSGSRVKNLTLPDTVSSAGVPFRVTAIGKAALKDHAYLTRVSFGKYVKTIGAQAFCGCKKLTTVVFDSALTTIGKKAFYKCRALKKLTLTKNIKTIGAYAFYGDKKLKKLIVKTSSLTTNSVGSKAFKAIAAGATFKVPAKKAKSYRKLFKAKGAVNVTIVTY